MLLPKYWFIIRNCLIAYVGSQVCTRLNIQNACRGRQGIQPMTALYFFKQDPGVWVRAEKRTSILNIETCVLHKPKELTSFVFTENNSREPFSSSKTHPGILVRETCADLRTNIFRSQFAYYPCSSMLT